MPTSLTAPSPTSGVSTAGANSPPPPSPLPPPATNTPLTDQSSAQGVTSDDGATPEIVDNGASLRTALLIVFFFLMCTALGGAIACRVTKTKTAEFRVDRLSEAPPREFNLDRFIEQLDEPPPVVAATSVAKAHNPRKSLLGSGAARSGNCKIVAAEGDMASFI